MIAAAELPRGSVVIPAHDEQRGLRRCLTALLAAAKPGEFEVIVVANGCTDGTADVARSFGVICVETDMPSKINALNLGDDAATVFPRIYLDADVRISTVTARRLLDVLRSGPYLAAAPRFVTDLSYTSRPARRYLSVWQSLPVFDAEYVGSGCYALAAAGRARFDRFPDLIGDDRFVDNLFSGAEKLTLRDQPLMTVAPRTLRGILRRSLRVRAGSLQLRATERAANSRGAMIGRGATSTRAHLIRQARDPRRLPDVAVFAVVQVVIAVTARIRRRLGTDQNWLRDDSSRA